jgi:hypothetical protein
MVGVQRVLPMSSSVTYLKQIDTISKRYVKTKITPNLYIGALS